MKCKNCICCFLTCFILLNIILISIIIGLRYTTGNSYSNHGQDYGPTDTRLIPFSKSFCQSLSLETTYSGQNEYNISFYMLSTNPGLFARENFSIPEKITVAKHFLFYMHSESEVTVSACFIDSAWPLTSFYLVKGIDAYAGGYARPRFRSTVAEFAISNDCRSGSESLSHFIEESDFYYLIFRSDIIGDKVIHINASMFINLTQYSLYNNTITSSCSLSTSSNASTTCSLPVSLYTNSYALLAVQPSFSDVDRLDEIPIKTNCVPRLWVYIVPPFLLAILLICGSYCCCCWMGFWSCKKRLCYCVPYLLVIILVSILLCLRFIVVEQYNLNYGQSSAPNDSRLIPFSNIYCESLKLRTNYNGSNEYNASLYLLPSRPELDEHDIFSVSEIVIAEIKQHYLFYMNSGSNVTVSACFVNDAAIIPQTSLYISRGIGAYNGGYIRSDIKSVVAELAINSYNCRNDTLSYSVTRNDFYYFIFHTSIRGFIPKLHLKVNISYDLTRYAVYDNTTITSSCSLSTSNYGSTCSLGVPLVPYSNALLTVQPVSSDVDRLDKISLETHCVPRLWGYIVPPILLTSVLIIVGICYYRKNLKRFWRNLKRFWRNLKLFCQSLKSTERIMLISDATIEDKFKHAWARGKGMPPKVKAIFVIKHKIYRKLRWYRYIGYHTVFIRNLRCIIMEQGSAATSQNQMFCARKRIVEYAE